MQVDSTVLLTTNFDPAIYWSSPWVPNWFGETHNQGDDIAGTASSPVYFNQMCYVANRTSGCNTPSSYSLHNTLPSRYGDQQDYSFEIQVWTL